MTPSHPQPHGFDRRKYAREYARKQRATRLAAERQHSLRCPRKFGPAVCGDRLVTEIDRLGRTGTRCLACERFERGICRDCPRPVVGQVRKARYCDECRKAHTRQAYQRYANEHRDKINRHARKYARKKRKERAEYKRQWRKKNPDKVKAQKRRFALRQNARQKEYLKEWRNKNPEKMQEYKRRRDEKRRQERSHAA